jgi:hypothetical protein
MEPEKAAPAQNLGSLFKPILSRMASGVNKTLGGESKVEIMGKPKNKGVSREQQYW